MFTRTAVVTLIIIGAFSLALVATGIDAVCVTVSLPFGNTPLLIGFTIREQFSFGYGVSTLVISPQGKTLILIGAEFPLGNNGSYLRLDGGISYFDMSARFPSPVFGGGLAYRIPAHGIQFGAIGEFLYPFALSPPMFSLEGGWSR